jgi:N-acetylmuramic acid 6-phosphate etherase
MDARDDRLHLEQLITEGRNPNTMDIDQLSTVDMLTRMNDEDQKIADAVKNVIPAVAEAVDRISENMKRGGRLFYIGAGTSGRLGILDASECPPTFGTEPELVQGVIAGGSKAVFSAIEGAEDSKDGGKEDLRERNLTKMDAVVGIAASGRTPYVIGGLEYAKELGCVTVAISCNPNSMIAAIADIAITPLVGPEVIMGSSRLKAGTAQKLVLNMISTGIMIRLGKVYSNLMVNLAPTNQKLVERSKRIVRLATGASIEEVEAAMQRSGYDVKVAIVMLKANLNVSEASERLARADGIVSKALQER